MVSSGFDQTVSELHARANRLNAKLATGIHPPELISEARGVVDALLDHVRQGVKNYEEFTRKVALSEEFILNEARQVPKAEQPFKVLYLRAVTLLETTNEAEARAARRLAR